MTNALCFLNAAGDEPPAQGHVLDPQPVESRLPGHTWAWQPAPARWAGRGGGAGYQLLRLWRHRVRAPTPTGSLTGQNHVSGHPRIFP